MKTKYPSMFGVLAALILVVSFIIPANVVSPSAVQADPGICKWDTVLTPGAMPLKGDLALNFGGGFGGSEHIDMAVGGDGATVLTITKGLIPPLPGVPVPLAGTFKNMISVTNNNGIVLGSAPAFTNLYWAGVNQMPGGVAWTGVEQCYQCAIAPDDPNFWAVTTDLPATVTGPRDVWVTTNGGGSWQFTGRIPFGLIAAETIRCIDVSVSYGGGRDIAVGTADGLSTPLNTSNIYVVKSVGFGGWLAQRLVGIANIIHYVDFQDIKFSPSYGADAALVTVWTDNVSTQYNIALRDIARNTTLGWAIGMGLNGLPAGTEVRDPNQAANASAETLTLNVACLALPSDFNGQAASLRRAYVSLDAWTGIAKVGTARDGIFRMDDTTVYMLMDTSQIIARSIYSIAYYGTYASGKLLAGERMGFPCTATVPTWFTDSPTTCPIPCWYPALKPTTGAAGLLNCVTTQTNIGAALVGWRADGALAFAATSSIAAVTTPTPWFAQFLAVVLPTVFDETAFAISRNNGETWNQIAGIDTGNWTTGTLSRLVDVAPTPDCMTIYLASTNTGSFFCDGFDSVWRSSMNPEVVAPMPPLPIGIYWERVLCRVTAPTCADNQTEAALLRIVPYCADPSGQVIGWAVHDDLAFAPNFAQGVAMWSPDYGDYWAAVTPRVPVQDFCFESATVLYFMSSDGNVQKMPYTGTAWANTMESVSTILPGTHTIAAYPEGKVLCGINAGWAGLYSASYCGNFNTDTPTFGPMSLAGRTDAMGNVHVAFDTNFKDNDTIFIADDDAAAGAGLGGSVYRNTSAGFLRWPDTNMMAAINGAVGSLAPHPVGQFGIVIAFTGAGDQCALYSAHRIDVVGGAVNSGVCRTLWPLDGMPKPGIIWDCLIAGLPGALVGNVGVTFTREPSSLKMCGCCTLDTDTTLYAIDNRPYLPPGTPGVGNGIGMLWGFTDCLAKKGPALITEDKALIGCDPVSGRSQEVNLCWEQLCVADAYDIEIAKQPEFTIRIIDWVVAGVPTGAVQPAWAALFLAPAEVTSPCVYFPAGGATILGTGAMSQIAAFGNLECGHTYYWRVQVRQCATTQVVRSPWSEIRSFTVKAGLPVTTPYYGPQLLAPNNGCLGCPVQPASFSWSPFKETMKYKFVLASDAAMTQVVTEAEVSTTAFEYDGALNYSTNYFWRVMSLEPAPSDWSATFSFLTETAPAPVTPDKPAPTPVWVWVVIAIGAILVIVTLVLIFKTRRV